LKIFWFNGSHGAKTLMMSSKCAALELTHPANLGFSYKDATLWLEGYVRKKSLSFELKPIFDDDVKSIVSLHQCNKKNERTKYFGVEKRDAK